MTTTVKGVSSVNLEGILDCFMAFRNSNQSMIQLTADQAQQVLFSSQSFTIPTIIAEHGYFSIDVGINTLTPLAPLHVGNGQNSIGGSTEPQIMVNRNVTGSSGIDARGFLDKSNITRDSINYCSYDSRAIIGTATTRAHVVSFQSGLFLGAGTITKVYGFFSGSSTTGATLTNVYGMYAANTATSGGGSIGTQYGLYVEDMASAATNYAVYTAGTAQSFFGGKVTSDTDLVANASVQITKGGNDSFAVGSFLGLRGTSGGSNQWLLQLSASNNIDFWYYNGVSPSILASMKNTGDFVLSSGTIQLGNTAVSEVVVSDSTLLIKDHAGNSFKVLARAV